MQFKPSLALSAIAVASLISGCGGSGGNDDAIKVGDQFKSTISVDDEDVLERTYSAYGVTADGKLVNDPKVQVLDSAMIPILDGVKVLNARHQIAQSSAPAPVAQTQAFFSLLWERMAAHYNESDATKILAHIADLDVGIEAIHADYQASGLGMAQYVDFYEALDEFNQLTVVNNEELDLMRFLQTTGVNQQGILTALGMRNMGWRDFLAIVSQRGENFATLAFKYGSEYPAGHIGDFLDAYLPQSSLIVAADKAPPYLDIAKFAWQFIKDNRPVVKTEGAYTHALHSKDKEPMNYAMAKPGSTKVIKHRTSGIFGWPAQTETKFKLSGYYDATHASIPGHWMPSVSFDVIEAYAIISWHLNASANIAHVANVGTLDKPIPELPVLVSLNISGLFQNMLETFAFTANGKTGMRYDN